MELLLNNTSDYYITPDFQKISEYFQNRISTYRINHLYYLCRVVGLKHLLQDELILTNSIIVFRSTSSLPFHLVRPFFVVILWKPENIFDKLLEVIKPKPYHNMEILSTKDQDQHWPKFANNSDGLGNFQAIKRTVLFLSLAIAHYVLHLQQ